MTRSRMFDYAPKQRTNKSGTLQRHREKRPIMRHTHHASTTLTEGSWRAIGAFAAVLMAAGSLCLMLATDATAATLNGVATIAVAADPSQALSSGGSTTLFTVALPPNAACSGDTASDGYHVYSYLVEEGTDLSTVKFVGSPSTGFGFVNTLGVYYGAANTAVTTGQIVSIPADFEWGPLVSIDKVPLASLLYTGGTTGAWEAGIACANTDGALSDNWNTPITFTASSGDPNGFTWSATGKVTTTPTTTTTTTTTAPTSGSTTTTSTPVGSTSASTGSSSTSTTVAAAVGSTTGGTPPGGSGSDPATTSTGATTTGGLAFTGIPVFKYLGAGLLGIGLGLILLGWGYRWRPARAARRSQR